MELSHEDSLRLQVMLKSIEAIRIDEQALVVYGLATQNGNMREAKVPLNPNCRPEQYLRRVREFFSGAVLGSPGGYPVHLNRWTRMGQLGDGSLAELLLLGEPEAVTAVSCAAGLTDDLARRVWWIAPNSENARRMLERDCVVCGAMGPILAEYLFEHLPFETDARVMMETVRLILQPGLLSNDAKQRLWEKGARQSAYRVGFIQAAPDHIPQALPARADLAAHRADLMRLAQGGNGVAQALLRALDGAGQTFLETTRHLLPRIGDQDVIAAALNTVGHYFHTANAQAHYPRDGRALMASGTLLETPEATAVVEAMPALETDIAAVTVLARISEAVVLDVLAHSTASGTVLRKQLEPTVAAVAQRLAILCRQP